MCSNTCSGYVDMEGRNCSNSCASGSPVYYDENKVPYCSTCDDKTQAIYNSNTKLTTLECVNECKDDFVLFENTCQDKNCKTYANR